jgi:predicted dehydrogenase
MLAHAYANSKPCLDRKECGILEKEKIRIGVVGLGKMGLLHASILNFFPEVKLAALCDKSGLMVRLASKVFSRTGINVISDLEKLVDLDLDAVYVTTPISSHSFIARNIYKSGIARHLFVEKTLASTYAEADELCRLVPQESVNMVGYMKRFSVTFGKAKDLLSQGTFEEVSSFKAYAYSSDFMGDNKASRTSAARGGALRDLGCHVIDLALWFFGDFKVISVTNESAAGNSVSFRVRRSDGLEGEFDISQCKKDYRMPEIGLSMQGSKGTIEVNDDRVRLEESNKGKLATWYRHDLNDNVDFWLGETEYFREDQHFIKSILKHKNCEPSFLTASKVDFIIDQVRHTHGFEFK